MKRENNQKMIQTIEKLSRNQFIKLYDGFVNNESHQKDLLYWRCATNIELFAYNFFPHYCEFPFNSFHEDCFDAYELGERGIRRVDAAPRGYAKSTIKALIKPIHDVCYKLERFIVIASNTDSQSIQKLKDISTEFFENVHLVKIYGSFFKNKVVGSTDFIVCNGNHKVRFIAVGSKKEIRGARFGSARPSKIIIDDFEHSTEVENEEIRDKYENTFKDVFSKIGNKKTNIEVIGTILHKKSLLAKILKNPKYTAHKYKAIESWAIRKDLWNKWEDIYTDLDRFDDDKKRKKVAEDFYLKNKKEMLKGVKVLWEEHENYYELMEEIIETGYRSFMKEKQNSPMSDEEKIFYPENMKYFVEEDNGIRILHNKILVPWRELTPYGSIDPSTGQTKAKKGKKGDFTCILSGYKDFKGRLFVFQDFTKRVPPTVFIKQIFDFHEEYDFEKFVVEYNLYRNLLTENLKAERNRREKIQKKIIRLPFYDITQDENKEKRIYTLEPKVTHGWILFNKTLSNEFYDQLFEFPKADHDDCPDALEMLWSLVHNRFKAGALNKTVMDR